MIDHFSQAYSRRDCSMGKTDHYKERRNAQRFQVSWDVAVEGMDRDGRAFAEAGTLDNLSSLGGLVYLPTCVSLGQRLELQIKVPLKRNNLMKYNAEVVRLEETSARGGVGVKFDTTLPVFVER